MTFFLWWKRCNSFPSKKCDPQSYKKSGWFQITIRNVLFFCPCYLSCCNWVSVIVWTYYNGKLCWMTAESTLWAYLIVSLWGRNTGNIGFPFSSPACLWLKLFYSTINLDWREKNILDDRWPVPEPYWYHGELDVDIDELPKVRGRTLN